VSVSLIAPLRPEKKVGMSCEVLIKTRFSFRPLKYKSLPRHARNTRSLVATQTKVDPTAKKTKAAPAPAQAGAGVTNLGPKFGESRVASR